MSKTSTEKKHPFWDKFKQFFHRLVTKISLTFQGKTAVFTIEVDLTKNVSEQLKGIEHSLTAVIPQGKELEDYLKTVKTV